MAPASSRGQPQSPECLKSRGFSISGGSPGASNNSRRQPAVPTVGDSRHGRFCLSRPGGIARSNRRCYRISVEQKRNTAGTAPAIDALLEGLNPAQRSAATYGIGAEEGPVPPLLIAAGAGTGKTKTLAHRVARLIFGGADPRRLLLLTFTRRAALEMTRRAQQILVASQLGSRAAPRPRCCPGRAHFIRSATGCCAGTPPPSRWIPPSLCSTAPTAPI